MTAPKLQISNPKSQTNSKLPISKGAREGQTLVGVWNLKFVGDLEFGIWSLPLCPTLAYNLTNRSAVKFDYAPS